MQHLEGIHGEIKTILNIDVPQELHYFALGYVPDDVTGGNQLYKSVKLKDYLIIMCLKPLVVHVCTIYCICTYRLVFSCGVKEQQFQEICSHKIIIF